MDRRDDPKRDEQSAYLRERPLDRSHDQRRPLPRP